MFFKHTLVRYRYFQKQCVILGKELEKKIEFYYCHHVSWASFVQKIELYKLNVAIAKKTSEFFNSSEIKNVSLVGRDFKIKIK